MTIVDLKPTEPLLLPTKYKPTDDELGEKLIEKWSGNVRYLYGAWHQYEAGVWKPKKRVGLDFWQVLIDHKTNGVRPNAGKVSSVEAYCREKLTVEDSETLAGHDYINLKNGLFNLKTYKLEAHRPDLFMTFQFQFEYDPLAICPTWEKFLNEVLVDADGKPDIELRWLVQEAFCYSLSASTEFRVSFWLVGASGSGKSTMLNTLLMLVGDSHAPVSLETLKTNPYQLADVAGKRVVTFTEPDARTPLADGEYKRLVSKDTILARQIHGRPFSFVPICKVWGAMNDAPRVLDRSDAVFNRIIIIPMNRVIPPELRDGNIEDKLRAELPGIFNWALTGGGRLQHQGHFTRPHQSEAARAEYKSDNDIELQFVQEECTPQENSLIALSSLFQRYQGWCEASGYKPKGKILFKRDMVRLGYPDERKEDGIIVKGLTLKKRGWM